MDFKSFLVKAKVNSYPTSGEGGEKIREDGGKEFSYSEKDYKYVDIYYGHDPFIGKEIVWKEGKLRWGMNYYGSISSDKMKSKEVYTFLKKALSQIDQEHPFRGPKEFTEGQLRYVNEVKGNINFFQGTKHILLYGKKVYSLFYHGGMIKSK